MISVLALTFSENPNVLSRLVISVKRVGKKNEK
jgi:hypothetical protein